jgi:hypothetical protein
MPAPQLKQQHHHHQRQHPSQPTTSTTSIPTSSSRAYWSLTGVILPSSRQSRLAGSTSWL